MKYYVNTQTKMLGNGEVVHWMDKLAPIYDLNYENRFDVLVDLLPENVATVEINTDTDSVLMIKDDGVNIVQDTADNTAFLSFIELLDEMIARYEAVEAINRAEAQ